MRIRARLVTAFLLCGLVPVVGISALNIWNSRNGSQEISQHAKQDLRDKTEQMLVAVRDLKKSEIEDYFSAIRDQSVTFSSSHWESLVP